MLRIDIRDWTREKWLEYRKTGIGGSDAAALVGLHPFSSAYQVYLDKTGQLTEQEDSEAMRQGRDFEGYVAKRFEEASGKKVRKCNFILRSEEYPFMYANVDRMVDGEQAILECKTTSVFNKSDFASGEIPPYYYCQCQHYMAVTGYRMAYLAVLVLNRGFYWFKVPRNDGDIAALITAEHNFWNDNVLKHREPSPDGSERAAAIIKERYPESDDNKVIDLFGYTKKLDRLKDVKDMIKALEAEEARIQQEIQAEMKDAARAQCGSYTISWKSFTSNRVDTKKLQSDFPRAYEACMKPCTYRRFSIKGDK